MLLKAKSTNTLHFANYPPQGRTLVPDVITPETEEGQRRVDLERLSDGGGTLVTDVISTQSVSQRQGGQRRR